MANKSSLCKKLSVLVFLIVSKDVEAIDDVDDAMLLCCFCCCCANIALPIGHAPSSIIIGLPTTDGVLSSSVSMALPPVVSLCDDDDAIVASDVTVFFSARDDIVDVKLSSLTVRSDDDS